MFFAAADKKINVCFQKIERDVIHFIAVVDVRDERGGRRVRDARCRHETRRQAFLFRQFEDAHGGFFVWKNAQKAVVRFHAASHRGRGGG